MDFTGMDKMHRIGLDAFILSILFIPVNASSSV